MGIAVLEMARMVLLSLALVTLYLAQPTVSWCTTAGGVGEHSKHCPSSVDFEACFAKCQCYDAYDNPTHTHDALCILDECFCVFDACPYGRVVMSDYPWPAYYYPAYDDQQYHYRGGDKDQQQEVGT